MTGEEEIQTAVPAPSGPGESEAATMDDETRVGAYLRLYERQMSHYEATQGVEWKVSFGVWALLALAIRWAAEHSALLPVTWAGAAYMVPIAHSLWLMLIHRSQETDKGLWARYRAKAEEVLHVAIAKGHPARSVPKEVLWLAAEAGISLALALILATYLRGGAPAPGWEIGLVAAIVLVPGVVWGLLPIRSNED